MTNTLGAVLLTVGILAIVGGLVWSTFAYIDEKNNQSTPGPFSNPDRTNHNSGQALYGLYLAGFGVILAVGGGVLIARRPASTA